ERGETRRRAAVHGVCKPRPERRAEALERVEDEAEHTQPGAEHAPHVGGADVAGAVLADVHAAGPRDEEPDGDRPHDVREHPPLRPLEDHPLVPRLGARTWLRALSSPTRFFHTSSGDLLASITTYRPGSCFA